MAGASGEWSASRLAVGQRGPRFFGLVAAAAIAIVGIGCGADPLPPPPGGHGGQTTGPGPGTGAGPVVTNALTGKCPTEDEVRECHVLIGQHAGITSCYYGIQRCSWGAWTECREGEYSVKSVVRTGPPVEPASLDQLGDAPIGDQKIGPAATPQIAIGENGELAQPLATAKAACNDPCDPTCQKITESGAYTVNGQTLSAWAMATQSTLSTSQAGLNAAGLWPTTCYTAGDCEFGMFCQNPATANLGTGAGQCSHDKCAVGPALAANCGDTCVAAVCAANPNCCTYTGACAPHGPCATGDVLTCQASDASVAAVCADPSFTYCCDTNNPTNPGWDAGCVNAYGTYSGVACPADPLRAWDSIAIDPAVGTMACTQLVHDVCGLTCPNNAPNCDHDLCAIGSGLTAGCAGNGCVTAVCNQNPSCCGPTGTWSQACINALPLACGVSCPAKSGVCTKYLPNQVDAQCNGADLVAGVPCFDSVTTPNVTPNATTTCTNDGSCGTTTSGIVCQMPGSKSCIAGCRGMTGNGCPNGYTCSSTTSAIGTCYASKVPNNMTSQGFVPLCNVGTQPTPVNTPVAINVYGGNASTPSSWPASPPNGATRSCSTATIGTPQVLPGKCVDVPCVTAPNDQIYVNPPNPVAPYASTAQVAECSAANNWTLNLDPTPQKVTCDAPVCALNNGVFRSLSSHIVVQVENSSIMPSGEFAGIRNGLSSNLALPLLAPWSSSNIYVDTTFFPDSSTNCTATGAGSCAAPPNCVRSSPGMVLTAGLGGVITTFLSTITIPPTGSGSPPPYITALLGALETAKSDVQGTLALNPTPTAGTQYTDSVVLILGSDMTAAGNNYCGSNVTSMAGLAAQYLNQYNIRTFVIAVGPAKFATAQTIATAGGGMAFYVANDASISNNIDKALRKVEAYSDQACSYALPPVSLFDPTSSSAKVLAGSAPQLPTNYRYSTPTPITQVTPVANWSSSYNTYLEACLANCPALTAPGGGSTAGWCYDDPTSPTRIYLCENTCDAVLFDPYQNNTISPSPPPAGGGLHGQINYALACPSYFANNNYPTPGAYLADFCDNIPGSHALWSYLGWNTVNAVDTSVTFQFQTADRVNGSCPAVASFPAAIRAQCDSSHPCTAPQTCSGGVCSGTYTVTASQANQVCQIGTAGCPVDLVGGMQLGKVTGPLNADCMNITVALNPNPQHTNTPTVNSFELRYSCPYTE